MSTNRRSSRKRIEGQALAPAPPRWSPLFLADRVIHMSQIPAEYCDLGGTLTSLWVGSDWTIRTEVHMLEKIEKHFFGLVIDQPQLEGFLA